MVTDKDLKKQRGRPFQPGQSGNPKGRPRGSGLSGRLRKAIAKDAPGIIKKLIEQAKGGDATASRLLLDKVLPNIKAESAAVNIAGLEAGTLTERAQAVLDAAASGRLSPDVAAALVGAVGNLAKVAEIDELERRIAALEEQSHDKP